MPHITKEGKAVEHAAETWLDHEVKDMPPAIVAALVARGHLDREEKAVKEKMASLAEAVKANIEETAAAGCSPCAQRAAERAAEKMKAAQAKEAATTEAKEEAKKTTTRGRKTKAKS